MWMPRKWVKEQTIVKITLDVFVMNNRSCREQFNYLLANNFIVKF